MSTYPWEEDERTRTRAVVGLVVAVVVHGAAAWAIASIRPLQKLEEVWVELTMIEEVPETPPPPEQLPEPEPEPRKQDTPRQPVDFEDTVDEVTPDSPEEAPPDRPVQRIQGLSASSFAPGAGTGFAVRAGTSLQTAAGDETMSIEDATVRFSAVTSQPRLKWKPALEVPDAVKAAQVKGVIEVVLSVDAAGAVIDVQVTRGLGHGADEACVDAWKKARFKPAMQGSQAVAVRNVPYRCRIETYD